MNIGMFRIVAYLFASVLSVTFAAAPAFSSTCSFGYAGVQSMAQLREVSSFSNVVMLAPNAPNFRTMLQGARDREIGVGLAWDSVLFDTSQVPFRLRPNPARRIQAVLDAHPRLADGLCFNHPVDEPYWNGVSDEEINTAVAVLKDFFPAVPTFIVLAWPTLDTMTDPVPSDWVAFNRYYIRDPVSSPVYQQYWNRMKELNPGKPIVVVADGFMQRLTRTLGSLRTKWVRSCVPISDSSSPSVVSGKFMTASA